MNHKNLNFFKSQLLLTILLIIPITNANASVNDYFGIAATYSSNKLKENYGNNIFAKQPFFGLNICYGNRFNDLLGIELGIEIEKNRKKENVTIYQGDHFAGQIVEAPMNYASFNTKISEQYNSYLAMSLRKIITEQNFISLLIGISNFHIKAKYLLFSSNTGPQNIARNYSRNKIIAIAKITTEHQFNDYLGTRVFFGWRNTARFKINSKEDHNSQIRLKDLFNIGIGINYYLN